MQPKAKVLKAILAALSVGVYSPPLFAAYPSKPISIVVSYPPGGSTDLVGRVVAEALAPRLGVPVIVENVGGAGGAIGAQRVVSAAPDGHTLLLGASNEVAIVMHVNGSVRYGVKDLTAIGLVGSQPMVLVGKPALSGSALDDVLALAKSSPGKLSFASSGIGTALHMAGELINIHAGVRIQHVPYKGAAQMVTDVVGGQIDLGVFVLSSALPHIRAGKMKAYGVTEARRSEVAPEIPALAENRALKDLNIGVWFGLYGPARMAGEVVDRLNRELNESLSEPGAREKLQRAGMRVAGGTPAELAGFTARESIKYHSVVRAAGIKRETQ